MIYKLMSYCIISIANQLEELVKQLKQLHISGKYHFDLMILIDQESFLKFLKMG
jgi:hypothetical protein